MTIWNVHKGISPFIALIIIIMWRPLWKFTNYIFAFAIWSHHQHLLRLSLSRFCIHIQVSTFRMDNTMWYLHMESAWQNSKRLKWMKYEKLLSWNAIRSVLQSQNIFEYYCLWDCDERVTMGYISLLTVCVCVCHFTWTHTLTPMHVKCCVVYVEWQLNTAISSQFFLLP